jgi:hypothetical protein
MTYSRFHLCDLQVHSPADAYQCYGDIGGPEPSEVFARRLVEAHAGAGVTVMAVTDHNRVDWYPALRTAGLAAGVTVFPGLEFSVNGCHLLAIWDATDGGYDRARRFLEQLFEPGQERFRPNRQPRPVGRGQVLEHARQVVDYGGLVFAPHATLDRMGVFARGVCSNSGEIAQSDLITGFDVYGNRRADVLINPRSEFADVPPRWFISGDTRSFDDIGKRAVYLKLGPTPDLEGIRQAFLVPETRVRFPGGLRDEWAQVQGVRFIDGPEPVWPRLTKVTVEGGFHDGLSVELAPGLNALIGGRGTGKSALVEIIRHALEAGQPDEQDLRETCATPSARTPRPPLSLSTRRALSTRPTGPAAPRPRGSCGLGRRSMWPWDVGPRSVSSGSGNSRCSACSPLRCGSSSPPTQTGPGWIWGSRSEGFLTSFAVFAMS